MLIFDMRFQIRSGELAGVLLLAGAFVYFSRLPLGHTDIWAHAKYGEWYAAHRTPALREPISPFSDHDVPFANVAWGSQWLYHSIYQLGAWASDGDPESQIRAGAESLRSFHLILLVARFGLLWLALRRVGSSATWASFGVLLFLISVGVGSANQRPQAFGLFFVAALLYPLSAAELSRRSLVLLPLMFLLWANLHGTFVVGLAILGLFTVGRAIDRRRLDGSVRKLFAVCGACALAACVNPHGPALYRHVIEFSNHPNLKNMTEWFPLSFSTGPGLHWGYATSLLLVIIARVVGRRSIGLAMIFVAAPFSIWPWLQARAIIWWWMVVVWILAKIGPGVLDRIASAPNLPEEKPSRPKAVVAVVASVFALFAFPPIKSAVLKNHIDDVVSAETPWRLSLELSATPPNEGRWMPGLRRAIREHYPNEQFQGTIFASETQGDFLAWAHPKQTLLFTHAHIFSPSYWSSCMDAKYAEGDWIKFLTTMRANIIVAEPATHAALLVHLRENMDWILVEDDAVRFVAVRRRPLQD
jgi:hypothetical protein